MIRQCILASILIHIIILSIKIPVAENKNKGKLKKKSPITVKIKQKKGTGNDDNKDLFLEKQIIAQLKQIQKLAEEEQAVKKLLEKCDTYYMGIGVVHSSLFGEISEVVAGGPADKAGIKPGDVPLDDLDIRDKYPEGTQITIPILRDGTMLQIPVIIGKICTKSKYENKKP